MANKKDIKLIAFDLDSTLLKDIKSVSNYTLDVLNRASEKGIYLVPATGRPVSAVPANVKSIPGIRYVICSNGALVWDKEEDKIIRQAYLSREQAILIFHAASGIEMWKELTVGEDSYISQDVMDHIEEYVKKDVAVNYFRSTRKTVDSIEDYVLQCENRIVGVCFFNYQTDKVDEVEKTIHGIPEIYMNRSLDSYLEIGHETASKGQAVSFLADYLEIDMENTLTFGDGLNDSDMLERAGIGVAMENGHDDLKKIADIIAPSNEEDGVAKIIEQYL